jgi:hypothetical protein
VYNNKEWRDSLFLGMDYGADNQVMTAGMGDAAAELGDAAAELDDAAARLDDAALDNAAAELNDAAAGLNNAAAGLGGAVGEDAGPGGSAGASDNGGGRQATGGPEAAARIAPAPKSVEPEPPQADGAQDAAAGAAETGAVQDARALALMDELLEAADGLTASTKAASIEAGPTEVAPNEAEEEMPQRIYASMTDGTNGGYDAAGRASGGAAAESAPVLGADAQQGAGAAPALGADAQQAAEPAPALGADEQQAAGSAPALGADTQQGFGASEDPERRKCDELVKEKLKGWAYDVISITRAGTGYRYRIYAYRDGSGAEVTSEMELVCDGGRAEFAAVRLIDELEEV